jgi:dienelactone hydrolase
MRYAHGTVRKTRSCLVLRWSAISFLLIAASTLLCAAAEPAANEANLAHHDLTYFILSDGRQAPIHTAQDWQKRRRQILAGMQEAMGPLPRPKEPVKLNVRVLEEHEADGFMRRKLAYHTDRNDYRVSAWLLVPASETAKPRPAVLCLHQTTVNGKDSPAGLSDRPSMHYALELVRRGFVTLAPDYPSFGDHKYDFDADSYESGSMKAIYDNMRAIDLLQSLPEVDPDRIGCIGHSLGGHNALFTAAFDERIKSVVTSCGFTSFDKYMNGDLQGWSGPRYMPRIATRFNNSPDRMPFDFPEVLAAIAPRAVFIVAPQRDDNFDVAGVRKCIAAARPIFALLDAADQLEVRFPDDAHDFTDTSREKAYQFIEHVFRVKS